MRARRLGIGHARRSRASPRSPSWNAPASASSPSPRRARHVGSAREESGAWFDPTHNGEGWNVEELPDGRAQV
jgi:hypothetical protein